MIRFCLTPNVLLQASVALHASSWKQWLGTLVYVVAAMTWVMSLPKHSGSEQRNVATNAISGTPNGFSVVVAMAHNVGNTVD